MRTRARKSRIQTQAKVWKELNLCLNLNLLEVRKPPP
jgi:hypothetical protein